MFKNALTLLLLLSAAGCSRFFPSADSPPLVFDKSVETTPFTICAVDLEIQNGELNLGGHPPGEIFGWTVHFTSETHHDVSDFHVDSSSPYIATTNIEPYHHYWYDRYRGMLVVTAPSEPGLYHAALHMTWTRNGKPVSRDAECVFGVNAKGSFSTIH